MYQKLLIFSQKNFSEKSRRNIYHLLSFFLYWWAFVLGLLPLIILKLLRVFPLGKRFYVGTPIPRYYWDQFVMRHLKDFKGAGIEIDSKKTIQYYSDLNKQKNGEGLEILHAIDIAPGVAGNMIAESVKVKLQAQWPDYVFNEEYHLPSLQEVENYVTEHKHLMDMPSAAEVQKEGQDLGDMNRRLLQKVEELTLYLIDLKKQQTTLEENNTALQQRVAELEAKKQ